MDGSYGRAVGYRVQVVTADPVLWRRESEKPGARGVLKKSLFGGL